MKENSSRLQLELIAQCRAASHLDRCTPLGFPPYQTKRRCEAGLPAGEYFRAKHAAGRSGRFYPLHVCAPPTAKEILL
jgi:hypothetical protein